MGMFGFLKKKEEEVPDLETHEVMMSELSDWFQGIARDELKAKTAESEQLYKELVARFSDIRHRLEKLDDARISGGERFHIAANMIKESFTKKKYLPLNSIVPLYEQYKPDYVYFMMFQERVMEAIKELKTSTPKQTILLSRYFKRESSELVESIKKAEDASLRLREFLKAESGSLGLLDNIRATVKECTRLLNEAAGMDSRVSKLKQDVDHSKEKRSELEKSFLKLLKSKDWNEINSLGKEAISARDGLREAEMRLNSELSSIRRPLKEIEHVLGKKGNLTPIQKNILRDFVRDPLKSVMAEKGLNELQKCIKALSSKGVDVRDIDLPDLSERLGGDVPEMRSSCLELRKKLDKTEKRLEELSKLSASKDGMERDIRKMSEEAGMLDEEVKDVLAVKSRMNEQVQEKLRELETRILEGAQKKVVIRL
jgi:hypothetical protein